MRRVLLDKLLETVDHPVFGSGDAAVLTCKVIVSMCGKLNPLVDKFHSIILLMYQVSKNKFR